jgi:hypothetical protein
MAITAVLASGPAGFHGPVQSSAIADQAQPFPPDRPTRLGADVSNRRGRAYPSRRRRDRLQLRRGPVRRCNPVARLGRPLSAGRHQHVPLPPAIGIGESGPQSRWPCPSRTVTKTIGDWYHSPHPASRSGPVGGAADIMRAPTILRQPGKRNADSLRKTPTHLGVMNSHRTHHRRGSCSAFEQVRHPAFAPYGTSGYAAYRLVLPRGGPFQQQMSNK